MNNRRTNQTLPPPTKKPQKPILPYHKPGVVIIVPLSILPQVFEVNHLEPVRYDERTGTLIVKKAIPE